MINSLPRLIFSLLLPSILFSQEIDTTFLRLTEQLELAESRNDKVEALLEIGDYQTEKELKRAEQHFLNAIEIIDNSNIIDEQKLKARAYVGLGVVNRRKGDYIKAIDYYLKAQKIYEDQNDITSVADIIHNIAMVSRYQKDYRKAINGFKKAIQLNEQVKDTFGIAAGYNMLGVAYRQSKQLDSALISYKKAKTLFSLLNIEEEIIGVDSNIAVVYARQKKYDLAIAINKDILNYHKRKGNKLSIVIGYYNISDVYRSSKEYEKSLVYADSSLVLAKEGGFRQNIMKAYRRKSYLNGRFLQNFEAAHNDYRMYKRYSDSIF